MAGKIANGKKKDVRPNKKVSFIEISSNQTAIWLGLPDKPTAPRSEVERW
jgi:hypothetical protein